MKTKTRKAEVHAAIPTEYAGVHFKSRLEAQCAFLFDKLEWEWEYEPRSFMLPNGVSYTPDFYLDIGSWWECRGYETKKGERQIAGFAQIMASDGTPHPEFKDDPPCTRFIVLRGDREASVYEGTQQSGTIALLHCIDCGWMICPPIRRESQWVMAPLAIFCESCQAPMELPSWKKWDGRTRIDRIAVVTAAAGKVLVNGLGVDEFRPSPRTEVDG